MTRLPARTFDALVAAAVAAMLLVETLAKDVDGPRWANVLVIALVPAALLLARRRAPVAVLVGLLVVSLVAGVALTPFTEFGGTILAILIACYSLGRYRQGRELAVGCALLPPMIVIVDVTADTMAAGDWIFPAAMLGAAVLGGRVLRTRARVTAELADRHEQLSHDQAAAARRAADEERRHIARELHDVVAHTLSVMVVQAGAARRTLDRDPDRAVEALEVVEATGREALTELRRLLGWVAPEAAALAPQPTTADVAALVARAGEAGLVVTLREEGEPGGLLAGAEVAAYRIVQEALTNALKHAGGGTRAEVTLHWAPDALLVAVVDHGGAAGDLPAGGHGLAGMRERAALHGGALEAGPLPEGGFAVRARLPRAAVGAVA